MRIPPIPPISRNPVLRPFLAFVLLTLAVYSLLAHWEQHGGGHPMFGNEVGNNANIHMFKPGAGADAHTRPSAIVGTNAGLGHDGGHKEPPLPPQPAPPADRKVVAHFMLGNTYPYTERNWDQTLSLAEETGLDALVLNLGHEDWQMKQAETAYRLAAQRKMGSKDPSKSITLFLSLDMNVLPWHKLEDRDSLIRSIAPLIASPAQFWHRGRPMLTTFGGASVSWGRRSWDGFLDQLNRRLPAKVSFWPGFFLPPAPYLALHYVDGAVAWNNAWPQVNAHTMLKEDEPYLHSKKPYMATISPLFFTHYGSTGEWAFNKNFIYRSDDLLYPSRWLEFMNQPPEHSPEIIQVISWNDYGESHYIAPILGAEPGSTLWTHRMDHTAFREMTHYFAKRWRDGAKEAGDEIIVWMWYRPHPKSATASNDQIGKPEHWEWAHDLINIAVVMPEGVEDARIELSMGPLRQPIKRTVPLTAGRLTLHRIEFVPGHVEFEVLSKQGSHIKGQGRHIESPERVYHYNFNMWTGAWHATPNKV